MLSLRDTQIAFVTAIRSGDAGALAAMIVDDGIPPVRRLQIYGNNHRLGALATMQATYPVVERLGGADWFAQSVAAFQQLHPSRSGDLQNLGADYPQFLYANLANSEYLYFGDVAALEWAYQRVLTAAQCDPVDIELLNDVAPQDYEDLMFVPRPSLRLVESAFPVFAIWHANQASAPTDSAIRLDAGGSRVLLIRRKDHVELRELARGPFELLRQFQLGIPLGAAATAVAEQIEQIEAFDLTASLRELLGLEAIADILPARSKETP